VVEPQAASERAERFRASVQAFVADLVPRDWRGIGALDPIERGTFQEKTRTALAERGWVAPAWPREYGGAGLGPAELVVVIEELTAAGIPYGSDNDEFGITMLGNTMLRWSDPSLLRRFLPRIVSGEYVLAQGFSEPGAGSDLASLSPRAEPHGDQWVLNGQKLWSSGAHKANWTFVWPGPIPTPRRTAASACSWSPWTNLVSTSARSATSPARRTSTRSSSTTRQPNSAWSWEGSTAAGRLR
jgi:alkylation response protein AidB-like acyl-CoA dehydrogenase